ncbi:hypothetical protein N4G69_20260 [Streptomyces mirabilis]|uniref:hypothetical protein n=1 Tax=Streptomyces mirabilis TaxID=68239 RepID=UPI0021BFFF51|nr:hypothetical protein [Streptomyces mirabilis]MCT9107940.1 hypothetical protein [Streptomyces mirabilis]
MTAFPPATGRPCGAPATDRIEGYSARDGLAHGSLDAIVYACPDHASEARAQWLSGLTPHSSATSGGRHCGDYVDFTADGIQIVHFDPPEDVVTAAPAALEGPIAEYAEAVLDMAAVSLGEFVWRQAEADVPTEGSRALAVDCGPVLLRVSVVFEPTGRTREQAEADCLAGDPAEVPAVRAAARVVTAGGPGIGGAREALRQALAVADAAERFCGVPGNPTEEEAVRRSVDRAFPAVAAFLERDRAERGEGQ